MNTITTRSYGEVIKKYPKDMTTAELKAKADAEGLAFYRSQYEQDPTNPQAKMEYENYCHRLGIQPDKAVDRLYTIPMDELRNEFTTKGAAVEDSELEAYRVQQAKIWMASQKRYTPTMAEGSLIAERVISAGLKGTVLELNTIFEQLVEEGKIQAPPVPVELYSREQLMNMSTADMKAALQKMGY